jgi:ribonucleoside-diphosphate reductase alpha chain
LREIPKRHSDGLHKINLRGTPGTEARGTKITIVAVFQGFSPSLIIPETENPWDIDWTPSLFAFRETEMSKPAERVFEDSHEIPMQDASIDIWGKKYRLTDKNGIPVDATIDDTYQRVARSLADVEKPEIREHWYQRFLWALRKGAVPAGRVMSNAGAQEHKPATSTINCTVSGTIADSMNDILSKVHEAGLTLKGGSGIGYEFSTLRPKGAFVAGAGANTSGPLSFMDIFDKMCQTVSSAGGRRGAQMGTFDVGHPDVMEFIKAKREDGRLRNFNLSLLITDDFMKCVEADGEWKLSFPLSKKEAAGQDLNDSSKYQWAEWPITEGYITNEEGLVCKKVYNTIKARRLWDLIMASTYDFAEPGFILIDKYNEYNNNWFCENIRATNPCVTADTWVQTAEGPRQVAEIIGKPFLAKLDGELHASSAEGFFLTATKEIVRLVTREGYQLKLTRDHKVRKVTLRTRHRIATEWVEAGLLVEGDEVLLNNHRGNAQWTGVGTENDGYLLGLLIGDGTIRARGAVLSTWAPAMAANGGPSGAFGIQAAAMTALADYDHRSDFTGWYEVSGRNEFRLEAAAVTALAAEYGLSQDVKTITAQMERASSDFTVGMLRGLFDTDGSVQGSQNKGVSIRLAQSDLQLLEAAQRCLIRLGIASTIYQDRREAGKREMPDGKSGLKAYACQAQHELVLAGDNIKVFADRIGFADTDKSTRLANSLSQYKRVLNREQFVATISSIKNAGVEAVYDVQVPGVNAFDANGLHAHNCGEQGLPPYGSCLLGSLNLTRFVREPFTDNAHFDFEEYRDVVKVFTRMLDNVVEIHGLAIGKQKDEIESKRRHGMGYMGLGSTLAMLKMKYGSDNSVAFTEIVTRELAVSGWVAGLELAKEKGPAPILARDFEVTPLMLRKRPELAKDGYKVGDMVPGRILHAKYSRYMQRVAEMAPQLVEELAQVGARFTHHSSIAPTGTISLSLANNASNGIEPSFAHQYARNIIREGKKSKESVDVFSYELLAYRTKVNPNASPMADDAKNKLPAYFTSSDEVTPRQHVDIQAAAQRWIDSSISKTANVPSNYPYESFKDIYKYAHAQGLKGCTTFRFNPEVHQGVLVKKEDLQKTTYIFTLADGSEVSLKGDEKVEYDGETHTAANLFDALKEGYYGKL